VSENDGKSRFYDGYSDPGEWVLWVVYYCIILVCILCLRNIFTRT
jgi:hypothetical protein